MDQLLAHKIERESFGSGLVETIWMCLVAKWDRQLVEKLINVV